MENFGAYYMEQKKREVISQKRLDGEQARREDEAARQVTSQLEKMTINVLITDNFVSYILPVKDLYHRVFTTVYRLRYYKYLRFCYTIQTPTL